MASVRRQPPSAPRVYLLLALFAFSHASSQHIMQQYSDLLLACDLPVVCETVPAQPSGSVDVELAAGQLAGFLDCASSSISSYMIPSNGNDAVIAVDVSSPHEFASAILSTLATGVPLVIRDAPPLFVTPPVHCESSSPPEYSEDVYRMLFPLLPLRLSHFVSRCTGSNGSWMTDLSDSAYLDFIRAQDAANGTIAFLYVDASSFSHEQDVFMVTVAAAMHKFRVQFPNISLVLVDVGSLSKPGDVPAVPYLEVHVPLPTPDDSDDHKHGTDGHHHHDHDHTHAHHHPRYLSRARFGLKEASSGVHVLQFLRGATGGVLTPLPPPASEVTPTPTPPTPHQHVTTLTRDTLLPFIRTSEQDSFVLFFDPLCGHCQDALAAFDQLAEAVAHSAPDASVPPLLLARLDVSAHDVDDIVHMHGVPTLILFSPARGAAEEFEGDTADATQLQAFLDAQRKGVTLQSLSSSLLAIQETLRALLNENKRMRLELEALRVDVALCRKS